MMAHFMSRFWSTMNNPFWLTRREYSQEVDLNGNPYLVRIERTVLEPGFLYAVFMFLIACLYYFILSIPVIHFTAQKFTIVHWPSVLILAGNSTYRFVLKYHERLALVLEWNDEVGRESSLRKAWTMFVGFVAGISSGLLADWLISGGQFTPMGISLSCMLGVAEMVWNGKRLAGGAAYDHIEVPQVHEVRTVVNK